MIAASAGLVLGACGGDDDQPASTEAPAAEEEFAAEPAAEADLAIGGGELAEQPAATVPADAPATGGSTSVGLPFDETFGRDLIIEAGLTMSTPNVQQTLDDVYDLTRLNGGRVFAADVNIGEQLEDGSVTGGGTVEVRIPPDDLDDLISGLSGVARISNVSQDTQDVTERLIDLEIRIRQARTGIEQIEQLYAVATEFADLVEIEQELARRQIALEELLATQRGVEGRVALSTLTVTIAYEPLPAVEPVEETVAEDGETRGIDDAFRDGWSAFAGVMFAVGFVLAIAAPFLVLAAAILLVAGLATRVRGRRRSLGAVSHPSGTTPADEREDELVTAGAED